MFVTFGKSQLVPFMANIAFPHHGVCRQCWLQSKVDSTRKWLVLLSAVAVKDWVLRRSESTWPCICSMFSVFASEQSVFGGQCLQRQVETL